MQHPTAGYFPFLWLYLLGAKPSFLRQHQIHYKDKQEGEPTGETSQVRGKTLVQRARRPAPCKAASRIWSCCRAHICWPCKCKCVLHSSKRKEGQGREEEGYGREDWQAGLMKRYVGRGRGKDGKGAKKYQVKMYRYTELEAGPELWKLLSHHGPFIHTSLRFGVFQKKVPIYFSNPWWGHQVYICYHSAI